MNVTGVIEPSIDRSFGILVAEDDFSDAGPIPYHPATVGGSPTDLDEIRQALEAGAKLLAKHVRSVERTSPPPAGSPAADPPRH